MSQHDTHAGREWHMLSDDDIASIIRDHTPRPYQCQVCMQPGPCTRYNLACNVRAALDHIAALQARCDAGEAAAHAARNLLDGIGKTEPLGEHWINMEVRRVDVTALRAALAALRASQPTTEVA